MILTKLGQHVNEMMAVAVNKFHNCLGSSFFIIRQNVNMATNSNGNAILHCGLTSIVTSAVFMPLEFSTH